MRGGVLLAEDNPTLLLARYNSDDLEDVFLRLSLQQNEQNIEVIFHDVVVNVIFLFINNYLSTVLMVNVVVI